MARHLLYRDQPIMPSILTDKVNEGNLSEAQEHIAEEFNRILAVNLNDLDETQIDAFVDLGESMGLPREKALEIVAELINQHIEDAEERGIDVQWISNDLVDYEPEVLSSESPACESEPLLLVDKPEAAPKITPEVAPVLPQRDLPPGVVPLGRAPRLERGTVAAEEEREANRDFNHPSGISMIYIPSGSFIFGSEDPDSPKNEKPAALTTLSGYYMSRFPITNAEYEKFDPSHASKRLPGSGPNHPVVFVTSLDAVRFCEWLSKREPAHRYRLPTEAEWEYAAKGSEGRRFPWGDEDGISSVANFADASSRLAWRAIDLNDGYAETSPVGSFPDGMSPFRIEDMSGNVFEWCLDFYDSYRAMARTNPRGPAFGVNRVIRGGSYKSRYAGLRTTSRSFNLPTCAANDIGFRVVGEPA